MVQLISVGSACSVGASEKNAVNSQAGAEGEGAFIFYSYSCGFSTTNEKVASLNMNLYECEGKKRKKSGSNNL